MNRVALVTGAARGIGKAIAQTLAEEGMAVAMLDIDESSLTNTAEDILKAGLKVLPVRIDLSDSAQIGDAVNRVVSEWGWPDTVVNNAGLALGTPFEQVSESEWDKVFEINLKASFLIIQALIPKMIERQFGRIINISSMAGVMGSENAGCHYCASKAGTIGLVKYLSKCYARNGITANAIAPGPIDSEMVRGLGHETYNNLLSSMPMRKLGTTDDIAAAVALLASDRGGFITGTVLEISGGQIIV